MPARSCQHGERVVRCVRKEEQTGRQPEPGSDFVEVEEYRVCGRQPKKESTRDATNDRRTVLKKIACGGSEGLTTASLKLEEDPRRRDDRHQRIEQACDLAGRSADPGGVEPNVVLIEHVDDFSEQGQSFTRPVEGPVRPQVEPSVSWQAKFVSRFGNEKAVTLLRVIPRYRKIAARAVLRAGA